MAEVNGVKLGVTVGFIVISALCGIHAADIGGGVVKLLVSYNTAADHGYGIQNVKQLGDAAHLIFFADGVHGEISRLDKTRGRRIITRQTEAA